MAATPKAMLTTLRRRHDYLKEQIRDGNHSPRSVHWLKAEREALGWAIEICEMHAEQSAVRRAS